MITMKDKPSVNELCALEDIEAQGLLTSDQRAELKRARVEISRIFRPTVIFLNDIKRRYPHTWNTRFSDLRDDLKHDPEKVIAELRARTLGAAEKRIGWLYDDIKIRKNKLSSPELGDLPEEVLLDLTASIFDSSQLPGEILEHLESIPYGVWNTMDTERDRLHRRDFNMDVDPIEAAEDSDELKRRGFRKEMELIEAAGETGMLFTEQEKAVDLFKIRTLLKQNRDTLPSPHREVMRGIYIEDKTQTLIATELGLSKTRIGQLKNEALNMLYILLNREIRVKNPYKSNPI